MQLCGEGMTVREACVKANRSRRTVQYALREAGTFAGIGLWPDLHQFRPSSSKSMILDWPFLISEVSAATASTFTSKRANAAVLTWT